VVPHGLRSRRRRRQFRAVDVEQLDTNPPLLYPDAITLAPQINPSQVVAAVDAIVLIIALWGCSVSRT